VNLLPDGSSYPAKLALVRAARKSLYLSVMAFACDGSTQHLLNALIERKRAGVDVRFFTERVYRESLSHFCVDRMLEAGIKVSISNDAVASATRTAAMHQKVWLRDDEEAIIGGENILDYENEATGFNFMNHDSDLHLTGPAVRDATRAYLEQWLRYDAHDRLGLNALTRTRLEEVKATMAQEERDGLRGENSYAARLADPAKRMDGACRVALQGSMAAVQPIGAILLPYLENSRRNIMLTTPDVPYDPDSIKNADKADSYASRIMRLLKDRKQSTDPRVLIQRAGRRRRRGQYLVQVPRGRGPTGRQWLLHAPEQPGAGDRQPPSLAGQPYGNERPDGGQSQRQRLDLLSVSPRQARLLRPHGHLRGQLEPGPQLRRSELRGRRDVPGPGPAQSDG
jgi:phosphatidylserine/phosphatidylglycerophosphate/cardiolipin synthase-like enzyme